MSRPKRPRWGDSSYEGNGKDGAPSSNWIPLRGDCIAEVNGTGALVVRFATPEMRDAWFRRHRVRSGGKRNAA